MCSCFGVNGRVIREYGEVSRAVTSGEYTGGLDFSTLAIIGGGRLAVGGRAASSCRNI